MNIERATYSYIALRDCIEEVKKLPLTVQKKSDHKAIRYRVFDAYNYCLDKTQCCLFEADYSPYHDYSKAVDRNASKKELDNLLRQAVRFLQNELTGIYNSMEIGEVNTID